FGGFGQNVGDGGRNLAIDANGDGFLVGESGGARGGGGRGNIFFGATCRVQGGHADGLALAPASSGPVCAEGDYHGGEKQAGDAGSAVYGHGRNPYAECWE